MPPLRGGGLGRGGLSTGNSGKNNIDTNIDKDGRMTIGKSKLPNPPNLLATTVPTITVERAGPGTSVTVPAGPYGAQLRLLFDHALQVVLVAAEATPTGVQLRRLRGHMCDPLGNRFVIPVAYEPLVLQLLDTAGIASILTGWRPVPLLLPKKLDQSDNVALLAAVARNERLVVRVGKEVDVAVQIVRVCRAFPALRIVVLVKRVEDARRIAHLLQVADVAVSRFTWRDRECRSFEPVAVTTYRHAGDERVGLWDADMVIVHDVADALGVEGRETLRYAHRDHPSAPRVIGFARIDFEPSYNQYAEMMNVYGPVELVVPAPGAVNRDVEYQFVPVGGSNPHQKYGTEVPSVGHVKRTTVWNSRMRNRLVARLACGLVDGDAETVVKSFPQLARNPLVGKTSSVLVVVENGTHARFLLHHHLHDWYAVGPDIGRVPQPSSWGRPVGQLSPAVCTFDGLAALNVAAYDVVIRVDAGTGALPLAHNALVTTGIMPTPLLVIDIKDHCNPILAPFVARRRAAYDALGWVPVGEVLRHRELDRFLARHPQGTSVRKRIAMLARRGADKKALVSPV